MTQRKKLSFGEGFSLMTICVIMNMFTRFLSAAMIYSGTAAWMSALIGTAVFSALFLPLTRLLRRHHGRNLLQILDRLCGRVVGRIADAVILFIIVLSASERLFETVRVLKQFSYPESSRLVLSLLLIAVAAYAARFHITVCGKAALVCVFFVLGAVAAVLLMGFARYEPGYLLPFWGYGAGAISKGAYLSMSALDNLLIMTIFADDYPSVLIFRRSGFAAAAVSGGLISLSALCYRMIFPYAIELGTPSGVFDIARSSQLGRLFIRAESLFILVLCLGMLCSLSVYMLAAKRIYSRLFSIHADKSQAIIPPLALIVLGISLIPDYGGAGYDNFLSVFRNISIFPVIAIGIILLIACIVRRIGGKRMSAAAAALIMTLTMCGCSDYREIESEVYAVVAGFDTAPSGYAITLRFMNQSADRGEDDGMPSGVYSVTASNLSEAAELIKSRLPKSVSLMQLRMAVFSQDLAEQGLLPAVRSMVDNSEVKNSTMMAVCRGSAYDFVSQNQDELGGSLTESVELMVDGGRTTAGYVSTTLDDFYRDVTGGYASPVVALCGTDKTTGVESKSGIEFAGCVTFDADRMSGTLSADECAMFKLAQGNLQKYSTSLTTEYGDIEVSLKSTRKNNISVTTSDKMPHISLKISADAKMLDTDADYYGENTDSAIEAEISRIIEEKIKILLSGRGDILGTARMAAGKFATIGQWESYNWKEKYSQAQFDIIVKVNL